MLDCFQPAFTRPTYQKVVELVVGTILVRGRRTVASALRAIGKDQERNWSKYHHVLNRAQWSGLEVSRLLLLLIVATFVPAEGIVKIAVDETLERRWSPRISKCGYWRDSRSSSKRLNVSSADSAGWFAVVVSVPWTEYDLALPFLSVLLTTPKVSEALGNRTERRHKSPVGSFLGSDVYWPAIRFIWLAIVPMRFSNWDSPVRRMK